MGTTTTSTNPWDTSAYLRVRSARFEGGELVVGFADGTESRVADERLSRPQAGRPDWSRVRGDDHEVIVPTTDGDSEISSFAIRSLTDDAFRAHLEAKEAESARWIGQRIQELRRGRGLAVDVLAARAGLPPATVLGVEQGNHDGNLTELQRLVEAMGHGLKDLVRPESAARPDATPIA